ncbi:unnamed protein product [Blepharisma stoltei]|uniref:Ion transport domain-containing protein n=1 Tax=Blepharisma stoltei TaxID=1481888 RepID=A0AAU9IP07_9CILI|nr:unnamed protein product [Blepharisma stoltei]
MSKERRKVIFPGELPSLHVPVKASPQKKRGLPTTLSSFLPSKDIMNIRKSQRKIALFSAIISISTIVFAFIENEEEYSNHQTTSTTSNILRWFIMILTGLHIYCIFKYYSGIIEIKKAYKEITKKSKIQYDYKLMKYMIIEMLSTCFLVPPYIDWKEKFHQLDTYAIVSVSDIIYILSFLRLYHIGKLLFEISSFNSAKAYFYSSLQNTKTSVSFTLKCYMQMNSFLCMVLLSAILTITGGLILHVLERTTPTSSFDYIWDAFWILCQTQETAGYGDIIPKTHLGRAVVVIACTFGTFFVSSMVIAVRELTSFSDDEIKFYSLVKYKKHIKEKLVDLAVLVIQRWWKYAKLRVAKEPRIKFLTAYRTASNKFHFSRTQIKIQRNPLFREQMNEISTMTDTVMKKMQDYLKNSRIYESLGAHFLKDEFTILEKIKAINKNLVKILKPDRKKHTTLALPIDEIRQNSSHSSNGSNSSRAAMKGRRQSAVKKMIMNRLGSFDFRDKRSKSALGQIVSLSGIENIYDSEPNSAGKKNFEYSKQD